MKRIIIYTLLLCAIALSSCKRQDLVSTYDSRVSIPITIDWSESGLPDDYANNLSVYFFPDTGEAPYMKVTGATTSLEMKLPEGRYSVLLFNDFVGDLNGISFEDEDIYSQISAVAQVDEDIVATIDRMAAWRLDEFEITFTENCGYCCDLVIGESVEVSASLLDLQPTPVTAQNTITLRVENLNNAQTIEGVLSGAATAATLSTNARHSTLDTDDTYIVYFSNRIYDDTSDPTDGVTSTTLTTFGKQPDSDATYELVLNVILNSGELATFTRDVTDQVTASDDFDIIITLTDTDTLISLPESQSSGIGVESWGDSEDLHLL